MNIPHAGRERGSIIPGGWFELGWQTCLTGVRSESGVRTITDKPLPPLLSAAGVRFSGLGWGGGVVENRDREGEQTKEDKSTDLGSCWVLWGRELGLRWGLGQVAQPHCPVTTNVVVLLQGSNKNEHGMVKCWGRDCRQSPDSYLPLLSY